ncbi:MAG: hypothetical protein JKY50_21295 [Oleispira sp.]|nr:hypothetical protein [Oleispira sp.]MBL4799942.1 hypothetical protein [Oleispira sp.]MBL4882097.1 hypothetical protein [Oleispira sp.]
MTDAQVQQVIDALLNATFLDDWYLYAIMFSVSLLGAWLGAYLKSYSSEKAKYAAIESSLDTIKKKVEATTKASENIKIAMDHDNWRKKELEMLKRQKLEDYYILILSISECLNNERDSVFFGNDDAFDQNTFFQAELIQSLYLPEILEEHNSLFLAIHKFKEWIYVGAEIRAVNNQMGGPDSPSESHMNMFKGMMDSLNQPRIDILVKLKQVAAELNQ